MKLLCPGPYSGLSGARMPQQPMLKPQPFRDHESEQQNRHHIVEIFIGDTCVQLELLLGGGVCGAPEAHYLYTFSVQRRREPTTEIDMVVGGSQAFRNPFPEFSLQWRKPCAGLCHGLNHGGTRGRFEPREPPQTNRNY